MTDRAKLQEHLRRQLGFLQRSCKAFDDGATDEAIRIATVIRVLLHDTRKSASLLKQLDAKGILLVSTGNLDLDEHTSYGFSLGVLETRTAGRGGGRRYRPALDDALRFGWKPLSVDEWWNQIVHVLAPETRVSRRDIVLGAANKDGGAHVDPKLTPAYAALAADGAIGSLYEFGGFTPFQPNPNRDSEPITDAHLVALRQMGWELLHSRQLVELTKKPPHEQAGFAKC